MNLGFFGVTLSPVMSLPVDQASIFEVFSSWSISTIWPSWPGAEFLSNATRIERFPRCHESFSIPTKLYNNKIFVFSNWNAIKFYQNIWFAFLKSTLIWFPDFQSLIVSDGQKRPTSGIIDVISHFWNKGWLMLYDSHLS